MRPKQCHQLLELLRSTYNSDAKLKSGISVLLSFVKRMYHSVGVPSCPLRMTSKPNAVSEHHICEIEALYSAENQENVRPLKVARTMSDNNLMSMVAALQAIEHKIMTGIPLNAFEMVQRVNLTLPDDRSNQHSP